MGKTAMAMIKGLRAASKYAGVSHETIRTWARDYGIGQTWQHSMVFTEEELAPFIEARKLAILADNARRALKK
jgi:hypothetical protein